MDTEALQANLLALKKLYGILMRNQYDDIYKHLDASSRLYLKKLLDADAEGLFESLSNMEDAKPSAFAWPCLSEQENLSQNPRFPSGPGCSRKVSPVQDNKIVSQGTTTTHTSKKQVFKLNAEMQANDLSQPSSSGNEPQSIRRRCQACQRKSMQGLMPVKQMKYLGENNQSYDQDFNTLQQPQGFGVTNKTIEVADSEEPSESEGGLLGKGRDCAYKYNLSDAESVVCSVRAEVLEGPKGRTGRQHVRSVVKDATKMDDISDDVVRLKRIESLLRSIQVPTKTDGTAVANNATNLGVAPELHSPLERPKQGAVAKSDPRESSKLLGHGHGLQVNEGLKSFIEPNLSRQVGNVPSKFAAQRESDDDGKLDNVSLGLSQNNSGLMLRMNQIPGRWVRAALKRMESLSSAKLNDSVACQTPEHIQGLRFTVSQLGVDEGHTQMSQKHLIRNTAMSKSPTPAPSVGSTTFAHPRRTHEASTSDHNLARIRTARGRNVPRIILPEKTTRRATPSNYLNSTSTTSRSNVKAMSQQTAKVGQRNNGDPYHQQSEGETSWGSPLSSGWSSQPSSSYASSSESPQSNSYDISESEGSESSDRRSSSQEFSSSPGEKQRHMLQESSSEDYVSSVSSDNQVTGRPHRTRITRSFRSNHHSEKRIRTGRFRRLKNKLGMIFHHHHHHHHHDSTDEDEAGHPKSLWRHIGKMFRHKTERDLEKAKVQESRRPRPVSKSVVRKQQGGHFHALVDRLMRRIRHSRKSKLGKDAIIMPGNARRGGRKVVNGLSLWQKLHSEHGVKLANKGRVKLGPKTKRPQLSMANMRLRD
ncbi:KOKOPELLI-like protein [Drosera capensis]